jgi:hypothetical protein
VGGGVGTDTGLPILSSGLGEVEGWRRRSSSEEKSKRKVYGKHSRAPTGAGLREAKRSMAGV